MRVLNIDLKKTPPNDFFPNIDLINYSRCPIFIIHGQDDEEVSIEHAKILFSKCHRPYEGWWAKDAGHNNIEIVQRKDFFKKCYLFIQTIKNADSNKSEKEILADNMAVDWEENFKHFYRKFLNKTEENLNKDSAVMMIESMSVKSNEMCQKNLIGKNFFFKYIFFL